MNYSELEDFEINRLVAERRFEKKVGFFDDGSWCKDPDYCNNPSDAWPIIINNGIGIMKYEVGPRSIHQELKGLWCAFSGMTGFTLRERVNDANPLRAAMIVFLMMGD